MKLFQYSLLIILYNCIDFQGHRKAQGHRGQNVKFYVLR